MGKPRENLERQALEQFEIVANRRGHRVFKGQGNDNRLSLQGNVYYQFGDLRVTTSTHHIVVEVESAGGVTNLVKYWHCLESGLIDQPLVLLHIFRQTSPADYGSHLKLWDFLWSLMQASLGDRMVANCYTYRQLSDLSLAVGEFEKQLALAPRG
jgi:hypothetical protein